MSNQERLQQAQQFVHDRTCPGRYKHEAIGCMSTPAIKPLNDALNLLDQRPRDAKAARRIFHDANCQSGCGPESDHADRTQSDTVAALRKFRAQEAR